ncbi:MAG: HDOD domain-containing protein [Gammaproteobacteria bacterium]|nr:HDOD domain-containing protein [Gammaproteobacteria bacterium]
MSASLKESILNELIDELEHDKLVLPSLPEVALKVRDTVDNPNASTKELTKVITTDAALSARLIQISNSPLLRGTKKIESVDMAVTRMGRIMVKNCVNSILVQQMFQPTTDVTDKLFREFWEHSTAVAAISQALAGFAKQKPDQAMLAGLVHDIGTLPVIKRAEAVRELLKDEALLRSVIAELHTRIGATLLAKWDFPAEIIAVAREHENLQRNTGGVPDLVDVVMVANLQSYFGKSHPLALVPWNTVPAFARLGIDTEISVIDMEDTGASIKEMQSALRN